MSMEGWYCPRCAAHHGPHVDTCPNSAIERRKREIAEGWHVPLTEGIPGIAVDDTNPFDHLVQVGA